MKWFIFCLLITSMSLSLIGLAVDVVFHTNYVPAIEKWQNHKSDRLEHYLSEKDFFAKHPLFSPTSDHLDKSKDFADFLHSRIAPNKDYLFIPLDKQSQVLGLREKWMEKKFSLKAPQGIREIFNRALDYEYWDIEKTLKAKSDLSAREFIVAGQLLLVDSIKEDLSIPPTDTLKKIRHFAKLLLSCENLNYKLAGLSLLSKEQDFTGYIHQRKPAQQLEWETVPLTDLQRYRNFLYATYDYFDLLMPSPLLEKIFIQEDFPVGFCSIFRRKEPLLSKAAPLLKGFFPLEPGFSQEYSTYLAIREKVKKSCLNPVTSPSQPLSQWMAKIPFYRRIKALKFLLNNKSLSEGS